MTTTARRIRDIMDEMGYTQKDILDLCEPFEKKYGITVSKSNLSQYLSGRSVPNQWKLTVLASALNVDEGWLMGLDVPKGGVQTMEISSARSALLKLCNEAPEEQVSMLYRLVAAALNVKV